MCFGVSKYKEEVQLKPSQVLFPIQHYYALNISCAQE